MSEKEKEQYLEQIELIITRKLKPFFWIFAILTTILIGITVPLTTKVIEMAANQSSLISSEEAYRNFLPKMYYHQLQKDEHITDIEAIQNPKNASNIYMRHNNDEADRLDIRLRGK